MHWRLFEDYGKGIEISKKWFAEWGWIATEENYPLFYYEHKYHT